MDHELRASAERAIAAYLRDCYGLTGNVCTAVKGANWTFAVDDDVQTLAFVRLYRTSGRLPVDVASELAVLQAIQSTPALEVSRPLTDHWCRTFSEVQLPDGTQRLIAVFAPAAGRELAATEADFRRAGAALADLHRQSELARVAPNRDILSDLGDQQTVAMIA
ncbi:hypothetical protein O7A70_32710, partial [Mesorhizobium sp. Cs1299R1N1]